MRPNSRLAHRLQWHGYIVLADGVGIRYTEATKTRHDAFLRAAEEIDAHPDWGAKSYGAVKLEEPYDFQR